MQAHLHEKQVQHQTDIQYLEQELMDEDRAFQAKVLRSEAQLAAKKVMRMLSSLLEEGLTGMI